MSVVEPYSWAYLEITGSSLNRNTRLGNCFSKKSKNVMIQDQDLLKTFSLGVQKSPMSFGVPSGCKGTLKLRITLLPEKFVKNGKKQQKSCSNFWRMPLTGVTSFDGYILSVICHAGLVEIQILYGSVCIHLFNDNIQTHRVLVMFPER